MRVLNREDFQNEYSVGMVLDYIGEEWKDHFGKESGIYLLEYGSRGECDMVSYLGKSYEVVSDVEELMDEFNLESDEFCFVGDDEWGNFEGSYNVIVSDELDFVYIWVKGGEK